jgi:hypothetical protein
MCQRNVRGRDRILRLFVGMILVGVGLIVAATSNTLVGLVVMGAGLVGLATAGIGCCPLYVPLGISTARPRTRTQ